LAGESEMKINRILTIVAIIISITSFFLFNKYNKNDTIVKAKDIEPFSIGNKIYFEIPITKIRQYSIAENETLFCPSEDNHENKKSVIDSFNLTPTVVYCLNKKLFQKNRLSYDQQLSVNVLKGPFYLHLDTSSKSLDLRVDDFICCQINFDIVSGDPLESFLNDNTHVLLRDNAFNSIVITNAYDFCMFPLIFNRKVINNPGKFDISIIPETITEESLFLSAKDAKCILKVSNSDFGLLVSVLKAYSSYVGIN
jgi:hypothetical protein